MGWFGENCSHLCVGHCRDSVICNHMTGLCDDGCDAGWTGPFCVQGKISTPNICFFGSMCEKGIPFTSYICK